MWRRLTREWWIYAITLGLMVLGIYRLWPHSETRALKMTAGDATGLRHRLALDIVREASHQGMVIEVAPSHGSEAALAAVKAGQFDLALVQGGLATQLSDSVRQVSALHIEPLHLLAKPELCEQIAATGLGALAGRRINLGAIGSGTNALAREVLAFAGLRSAGANQPSEASYVPDTLSYSQLMSAAIDVLPDALFTVSSLPSPIASFMIEQHGYRLVPLEFGEALSLQALLELGKSLNAGQIDKRHLFSTQIPNHTYSVRRAEPSKPLETIGTRLLLVAHQSVHDDTIKRLLDVVYNSSFARAERPALDANLLDLPSEYPLHNGAELYRQRNKPLIAGDAVDYMEKLLAIAATVVGGLFFLVQWLLRTRRRQREASLASYMERVIGIENEIMRYELARRLDLPSLMQLQRELAGLKADAVRRFANGELQGEALIQGFLSLVNDARQQLTRLILHQRENIEQLSAQRHLNPDEIWDKQTSL